MSAIHAYLLRLRNDVRNAEIAYERQKCINDRKRTQYWSRAIRKEEAAKKQHRDIARLGRYERALIEARQALLSFEKQAGVQSKTVDEVVDDVAAQIVEDTKSAAGP